MTIYVGIDNGLSGGIAAYETDSRQLVVIPMPVVDVKSAKGNKKEYDIPRIVEWLRNCEFNTVVSDSGRIEKKLAMVILEKANAFPGQGVTSMFSIGKGFGIMQGILSALGIPYTIVGPKTWQKVMFSDIPHADTKQASVLTAKRLFPTISFKATEWSKKDSDGMTDAALMAYYGSITYK